MISRAAVKTFQHIRDVQHLLHGFAGELLVRGAGHDASKFSPEELGALEEMEALEMAEGPAPYGSARYEIRKAQLGPMLAHHYAHNPHHPEFYPDGVAGMDLVDLVEMVFDWKAAADRSDQALNLAALVRKYAIGEPLASILYNTATRKGWPHR